MSKVVVVYDFEGTRLHGVAMALRRRWEGHNSHVVLASMHALHGAKHVLRDMTVGAKAVVFLDWTHYANLAEQIPGRVARVVWCAQPEDTTDVLAPLLVAGAQADVVLVPAEALVASAKMLCSGAPPSPEVMVLPLGVDGDLFRDAVRRREPGNLRIGWIGNTKAEPHSPAACRAARDARTLATLTKDLGGSKYWTFHPVDLGESPLSRQRLVEYYQGIDVLVDTSAHGAAPVTVLEALACGREVVTTHAVPVVHCRLVPAGGYVAGECGAVFDHIGNHRPDEYDEEAKAVAEQTLRDWSVGALLSRFDAAVTRALEVRATRPAEVLAAGAEVAVSQGVDVETRAACLRPAPGRLPRVLLLADVYDWAFDQNEQDLAVYLRWFSFDLGYVGPMEKAGWYPNWYDWNLVYVAYPRWATAALVPRDLACGSARARWLYPEHMACTGRAEVDLVNEYLAFHTVARATRDELLAAGDCPRLVYLTNPVNTARFQGRSPDYSKVVACWNGNAKHYNAAWQDVKGFHSIIRPACRKAGVPLVVAEYNTPAGQPGGRRKPAEMPEFYVQGSVALCASSYEGASNSVMEAMAAGLVVVATDVGNHREMHESSVKHLGESGIVLVERTERAFIDALATLQQTPPERLRQMGECNRTEIAERWSWDAWADRYRMFFDMALAEQARRQA